MNEIEQLETCRDPDEAKRLMIAFFERKLREGTDVEDVSTWIVEALKSGRMAFRRRRRQTPNGHPYLVAELHQPTTSCVICGKPIFGRRSTRRYCSAACRNVAYRQRRDEEREAMA